MGMTLLCVHPPHGCATSCCMAIARAPSTVVYACQQLECRLRLLGLPTAAHTGVNHITPLQNCNALGKHSWRGVQRHAIRVLLLQLLATALMAM
jgi:hypothetical protein